MAKQRLIIDTDTGVDDAIAIMMAISNLDVDVIAITTVAGNIDLNHVNRNVCHLLDVLGRDIPVYGGAQGSLLREPVPLAGLMGEDGLGNVTVGIQPPSHGILDEPAALALIRLVKQEQGDFTLVGLGPLTNLALAVRLDPTFARDVPRLVIMGGAVEARGNVTPAAEFNFYADPEAAQIVLSAGFSELWILPWETSVNHMLTWDALEKLGDLGTQKSKFFSRMTSTTRTHLSGSFHLPGMPLPDPAAMLVSIDPDAIKKEYHVPVFVETTGRFGRGLMAVDWSFQMCDRPNAHIVTDIQEGMLFDHICKSLQSDY